MKKLSSVLLLLSLSVLVFSYELGDLEKRIIDSDSAQMLSMVMSVEKSRDAEDAYNAFIEASGDEGKEAVMAAYGNLSEADYYSMVLKLGMILCLSTPKLDIAEEGLLIVDFVRSISYHISNDANLSGNALKMSESRYFRDCQTFTGKFNDVEYIAGFKSAAPSDGDYTLTGSTWALVFFVDGKLHCYELDFYDNGTFACTDFDGSSADATPDNEFWTREGNKVVFTFNDEENRFEGNFISSHIIRGHAKIDRGEETDFVLYGNSRN